LGNLVQTELPPDQISVVIAEYEKAVSLSPSDYRLWMISVARWSRQASLTKLKSRCARPSSLRLRMLIHIGTWETYCCAQTGTPKDLRSCNSQAKPTNQFRPQLFNLAWQLNKDDFESLKAAVGNTPAIRAAFAKYLVERGRYDYGLRLWNTLTEIEKKESRFAGDPIIGSLIGNQRYHQAMEIWNEVAPGPGYRAETGHILDGGFENNLAHGPGAVFGWQVQSNSQTQIGIDAGQGHTGSRSLRVFFQVRSHIDTINVSQLVPVTPNTEYELECYLKTERLESAENPGGCDR